MEKLADGSCVFRNPRCEERVAKKFEQDVQRKREKTMFQVQAEIDQEEMQNKSKDAISSINYSLWVQNQRENGAC